MDMLSIQNVTIYIMSVCLLIYSFKILCYVITSLDRKYMRRGLSYKEGVALSFSVACTLHFILTYILRTVDE